MAEHLPDVASSDQHLVKPWFNGRLDFKIPVKDFAGQEFPLVVGGWDYLQNHLVAALVYRHNKHFINVLIGRTIRERTCCFEKRRDAAM